ncbi:acetyltransferase [Desulfonema ishimotonii]|uniref:Acetyltransferase n=2 Tax=Desulfonema ishimotonii TaxID=45657 RepID=A0A401FVB1_9BACT|nr:acetyltransferase [Desulfonema ishimotonii]
MVGHRCLITHGSEHLAREYGKSFSGKSEGTALKVTKIGNKVFLGMNAILLSGILIGERAVPDPGTMISREVPSWIVAAGSPMRFVKKYDPVLRKWVVYKGESGIL